MTKEQARDNLIDIKNILDSLDIVFILDGGTLLGAYRDKDFCEDDHNDIDLTTLDDWDKHKFVVEEAIKKGFTIYHIWKPQEKRQFYKSNYPTSGQIALLRNGIKVDLMFKRTMRDKVWWAIYKIKEVVYKAVPKEFYQETTVIEFLGEEFRRPKDIEDYLELRYGDWKTPVHSSNFSCYKSDNVITEYEKI